MAKTSKSVSGHFDQARADYDFMKESRFIRRRQGLAPLGGNGDFHIKNEAKFYESIEKCRDMDRNDMLVGQALTRLVNNIVQDGFKVDPNTGDKKLDEDLWQWHQAWASDPDQCDVSGEMTFPEMEAAICRAFKRDGDIIATGTEEGPIQLFEAHNIQTSRKHPNTFLGVKLSERRERQVYYIARDSTDAAKTRKETSVPVSTRDGDGVRQVFHVYDSQRRINMTRGVSELAAVFGLGGMIDDINFAKMVQQQVAGCFAVIEEEITGGFSGDVQSTSDLGMGDQTLTTSPSGAVQAIEGIQPGMYLKPPKGKTWKMDSPKVPNAEFFQHIRLLMQLLGVNLGMPLVMLMMDASETNFSGFRGAVDEARRGFRMTQRLFRQRFHIPLWIWRVNQRLANDPALQKMQRKPKIDIFRHSWQAPAWTYIQPVEDATANLIRTRNHQSSPRRIFLEQGLEFETCTDESVADYGYRIRKAKQEAASINAEFPDDEPITWRDIMPPPPPDGVKVAIPAQQQSGTQQPNRDAQQPQEQIV